MPPARSPPYAAPSVVLVNPQLGENIGMAARAMANFNLFDLHLVDPAKAGNMERAEAAASGAVETVKNASIHSTLPECLKDMHYVYATTARPRDMVKAVMTPSRRGWTCGHASGAVRRLPSCSGGALWPQQ